MLRFKKNRFAHKVNQILALTINGKIVRAVPVLRHDQYSEKKRTQYPVYLNVGAGKWQHPLWHNLDKPFPGYGKSMGLIHIRHDLMSGNPFDINDNTLKLAYTSHVIEHLNDKFVLNVFKEIHKCLKKEGIFRIVRNYKQNKG